MLKSKLKTRRSTAHTPVARRSHKVEYTIREAAELRGVHPRTVRRQIKRGEINARVEFVAALQTSIYYIPRNQLPKIEAKPGGRPRKLV